MSLVGKFVFHSNSEYHQAGEIVEQITPEIVLVRWDKANASSQLPGNPMVLVAISAMLERDGDDDMIPAWEFFDTREELDAYHEWLCAPSDSSDAPKVVKLVN
jgi:hypothetical protein